MENKSLFFELLQVAIGNRQSLSRVPIPEEWEEIYEMSKKQSLAGIAFAGVERLPQEQMPPGKRIRQWAVKAEKIREHNAKVSEDCRVISRFFEENGFDCVILKGQGNFAYYPEWLQGLRSAGDIDVWCWPKGNANDTQSEIATIREHGSLRYGASAYENGLREAPEHRLERKNVNGNFEPAQRLNFLNQRAIASDLNSLNSEASAEVLNQREAHLEHPVRAVIEFCLSKKRGEYVYYHNLDFPVLKNTPVEVHYRPTWLYNPFRNRVLQRWFGQFAVHNSRLASVAPAVRPITQFTVYDGYKIPSVEFNVVFQLLHLYKHIFEEGIGLRQLLDYYFVITKYGDFVRKRNATLRNAIGDCYENDIKDNIDNMDNETQSEIATIRERGSLRYGASAYDNLELLNQRSTLNSMNSEASAEVLNQRKARLEPAKRPSLTLGYLGRIEPNKGMTELLEALKKCKAEGIKFKVRFAGKEQTEGEYLLKFKEALGENFEYCGLVSDETKREFLDSLDVFVMPTYFEGLPMSLLETMSYGAVPVVTKVGSIPTVVKDGENGLFVKVKDADSICEALKKLDDDRSLLAKMSVEARRTIQENFSATKYVERLNEIYAGL